MFIYLHNLFMYLHFFGFNRLRWLHIAYNALSLTLKTLLLSFNGNLIVIFN